MSLCAIRIKAPISCQWPRSYNFSCLLSTTFPIPKWGGKKNLENDRERFNFTSAYSLFYVAFPISLTLYFCSASWLPGATEVSEGLTSTQQRREKDPEICLPYMLSFSSKIKNKEVAISLFLTTCFNEVCVCVFIYLIIFKGRFWVCTHDFIFWDYILICLKKLKNFFIAIFIVYFK